MAYRKYKKRSADEVRKAPVRTVRKRHYMLRTRRDGAWSSGIMARELSQVSDCARGIRATTDEDHIPPTRKKPNCSSMTHVKPIPDFPLTLPMEMNAPLRRGGAGARTQIRVRSNATTTKTPHRAVPYRHYRCGLPYLPQAAQLDTRDAQP